MFPSIEPNEVGNTGLFWLFLSYGFVLFKSSELISEGSDLLLLVPSMAGLVGSVVLPLLGAVPDGAIMLFSGLGDIETVQETLSVGVGALAGSTIMLLTVPFAMSVYGGRVDVLPNKTLNYKGKPKLKSKAFGEELEHSGVGIEDAVKEGSKIMLLTTIPYFLIQIPTSYLENTDKDLVKGEHYYALAALIICLIGFVGYLALQYKIAQEGNNVVAGMRQEAVMAKVLESKKFSLSAVLLDFFDDKSIDNLRKSSSGSYGAIGSNSNLLTSLPKDMSPRITRLLKTYFDKYDTSKDGLLSASEIYIAVNEDLNESIEMDAVKKLVEHFDDDGNGELSLNEFVELVLTLFLKDLDKEPQPSQEAVIEHPVSTEDDEGDDDAEEEEELPEDIAHLSPSDQQKIIKQRAFTLLFMGTVFVLIFSDPMVDVMQEIAVRAGINPFYVSFVLAPLASNASEFIASYYYALKKTHRTISISISALLGAAAMNNTFCLSIFMGLIYFRGLAWQYTAETISIILTQVCIYFYLKKDILTVQDGIGIFIVFPLSLVLVAVLTKLGFD